MVSFWPWRSDDSSPASFEKALSSLSAKITDTQGQLERTRSRSRRVKVLWSLYLTFAYLVYVIVLLLVVGWNKMGPGEWTGTAGGPVLIYLTRAGLTTFYNFRIETLSTRLRDQQAEQAKTVQRLKDATKYDSTLELLEKYGGEPKRSKDSLPPKDGERPGKRDLPTVRSRTGVPPPPTANIPRSPDSQLGASNPGTPQPGRRPMSPPQARQNECEPSAEFAPNAFGPGDTPPQLPSHSPTIPNGQYATTLPGVGQVESHWYDRIMDLLLGEDETAAKNRYVLICCQCRLVNGQAPPGTRSMADVGMWKCMGCGAMNGEIDEGKRIVIEVLARRGGAGELTDGEEKTETATDDSSNIVQVEKENERGSGEAGGEEQRKRRV